MITLKRVLPAMGKADLVTCALHELIRFVRIKSHFTDQDKICIIVTNPHFHQDINTGYTNTTTIISNLIKKIIQILTSDPWVVFSECIF